MLAAWALAAGVVLPTWAGTCNVPSGSHPTVGAALRDGDCTTVQLGAGAYPENLAIARDVTLQGTGSAATFLEGFLAATGATVDVTLAALTIDGTAAGVAGCWREALATAGGAEVAPGPDVVVLQTATGGGLCRLFSDGFESAGTLAWSSHAP
ncbi:MAG: hypothetical protein QG573_28 [Acidobacteriota bacterium]|nr:hypothetical protein [Acidobacteriota bacterium]